MKLVVVGGVAGGLSFAARMRRLDESAEIVVFEKGPYPSFSNCGLPFYVGQEIPTRESLLLNTPQSLKAKLNLDVRVNHEVISLDADAKTVQVRGADGSIFTESYDRLMLSPGARAARPPIAGLDSPRVHTLRTVDDAQQIVGLAESAKSALVIGGGFIGIEAAEALAHRGINTTIVEGSDHVMPPLDLEMAHLVTGALQSLNINVIAKTRVTKIQHFPAHDLAELSNGQCLEVGLIVLAAGVTPATEPFVAAGVKADERGFIVIDQHGRTNLPDVFACGDAVTQQTGVTGQARPVALAGPTNRAARLIADFIADPESARPLPKPISTSIFRVGPMTVAQTGANRAELDARGIAYRTIHTHPTDHGTFLPGAQPMQLMLHFAAADGRILGAQGIGGNGVDKRIDVIATALKAGLSAPDLIDLDLAYAPPYSAAKDPVNFLGYVAENVLCGRLKLWYAEEAAHLDPATPILDVRPVPEFNAGHLRGARCIPLTELRSRLDEVRSWIDGKTVYLSDDSGANAWLAQRILEPAGINAKVLSGGVNTVFAYYFDNPGAVLEM